MNAQQNRCGECGAALTSEPGREASCPVCTMRTAMAQEVETATPEDVALPAPETLEWQFPEYEIQTLIGRGGMGAVYRARHRRMDRLVALKVLLPDLENDPEFAERFEREARALGRLQHSGIVGVHDFGERDGVFYLVMEFVDGANLRELMSAGAMTPRDALALVPQICDALQYAHDQGVVHRDIKPENILVDQEGRVRIADFGLVKLLAEGENALTMTRSAQRLGTPHYMAPEQLGGGPVDHRADIFSLGVVLYELLTGGLPVGRFDVPSKKSPDARRLDPVVMRSLENEPEERFQNAREMKAEMEGGAAQPRAPRARHEEQCEDELPSLWGLPGHRDIWVHGAVAVLVTLIMFVPIGSRVRVHFWSADIMGVPIPLMVLSHVAAAALAAMRVRHRDIHRWLGIGVLLPSALIGSYLGLVFMANLLDGRERVFLSIAVLAVCGVGALVYEGWARWPLWTEPARWVGPSAAPRLDRGRRQKKDWEIRRHELRRGKRQREKVLSRVRAASASAPVSRSEQASPEPMSGRRLHGRGRSTDELIVSETRAVGRPPEEPDFALRAFVCTLGAALTIVAVSAPFTPFAKGWDVQVFGVPLSLTLVTSFGAAFGAWVRVAAGANLRGLVFLLSGASVTFAVGPASVGEELVNKQQLATGLLVLGALIPFAIELRAAFLWLSGKRSSATG